MRDTLQILLGVPAQEGKNVFLPIKRAEFGDFNDEDSLQRSKEMKGFRAGGGLHQNNNLKNDREN